MVQLTEKYMCSSLKYSEVHQMRLWSTPVHRLRRYLYMKILKFMVHVMLKLEAIFNIYPSLHPYYHFTPMFQAKIKACSTYKQQKLYFLQKMTLNYESHFKLMAVDFCIIPLSVVYSFLKCSSSGHLPVQLSVHGPKV